MLFKKEAGFRKLVVLLLLSCSLARAQGGLELAGLAVYTDTARDIYVAGLQTPGGQLPADIANLAGPITMEYRIATRRISSRGFSGTLLLQAELGSGHRAPENVVDVLSDLKQQFKGSLITGDQFEIVLNGDDNTLFLLNGVQLLEVEGAGAFQYLVQGWLGESASALLRDRLVAGALDEAVLLDYESLIPLNERVELVASWVEEEVEEAGSAIEVEEQQVAAASSATSSKAVALEPVPEPVVDNTPEEKAVVAATVAAAAATAAPKVVESKPAVAASKTPAQEAPQKAPAVEEPLVVAQEEASAPASIPASTGIEPAASALDDIDDREYQLELNSYVRAVMTQVFKNVRYPRRAVKRELEGQVELLAELSREGELLAVSMETSSGHDMLDRAAIKAVESATPFPELSFVAQEEFINDSGDNYVMLIPVKFMLN